MNRIFCAIRLSALLPVICLGAETMAYHFACEPEMMNLVSESPLLKIAPNSTPFVADGDELHDLTGEFRVRRVPLENGWVLWNQTQHLLVVHGDLLDQWRIDDLSGFREQTRHAKFTVDWIRSETAGNSSQEHESVFASVALLSKSGVAESTAISHVVDASGEWSLSATASPTVSGNNTIDSQFEVEWNGPTSDSKHHGEITTVIVIKDKSTLPLASWYVAGDGPPSRLTVKGEILLSDGVAWRESRLRQIGDTAEVCMDSTDESKWTGFRELPSVGDYKIRSRLLERDGIKSTLTVPDNRLNQAPVPFAEVTQPSTETLPNWPEAVIPVVLMDELTETFLDLRSSVMSVGIPLGQDDLVVYNPVSERLVVCSKEVKTVDDIESLFMVMRCRGMPRNIECTAWVSDSAVIDSPLMSLSIHARSGTKSRIGLSDAKNEEIARFEAEPTMGSSNSTIDLRYDLNCKLQQQSTNFSWGSQSHIILSNESIMLTDAAKLPDGRSFKQGLRAKVASF